MFAANQVSAENMEEVDEDIAVTQSQINFTCPLTQVNQLSPLLYFVLIKIVAPVKHVFCVSFQNTPLCICIQGGNGEPGEE